MFGINWSDLTVINVITSVAKITMLLGIVATLGMGIFGDATIGLFFADLWLIIYKFFQVSLALFIIYLVMGMMNIVNLDKYISWNIE